MNILKTFKINDSPNDLKRPQYIERPKDTQVVGYRDHTGESLIFCLVEDSEKINEIRIFKWISTDELVDPKYTCIGIKSRRDVCLFDTNEIQPQV
jgi:hypothetical protein